MGLACADWTQARQRRHFRRRPQTLDLLDAREYTSHDSRLITGGPERAVSAAVEVRGRGAMSTPVTIEEGFVPFRGYRTWYRVVGTPEEPGRSPLL